MLKAGVVGRKKFERGPASLRDISHLVTLHDTSDKAWHCVNCSAQTAFHKGGGGE